MRRRVYERGDSMQEKYVAVVQFPPGKLFAVFNLYRKDNSIFWIHIPRFFLTAIERQLVQQDFQLIYEGEER